MSTIMWRSNQEPQKRPLHNGRDRPLGAIQLTTPDKAFGATALFELGRGPTHPRPMPAQRSPPRIEQALGSRSSEAPADVSLCQEGKPLSCPPTLEHPAPFRLLYISI